MNGNKKRKITTIAIFSLITISLIMNYLPLTLSAEKEITLAFGTKPTVDGYIDRAVNEWNDAIKTNLFLYNNLSDPKNGLEIDLWMVQYKLYLYIAISFELVTHQPNEFVGILTSEVESLDPLK